MTAETVKMLESANPERRVRIVRRDDGHYTFVPEMWCKEVHGDLVLYEGWVPLRTEISIFANVEIAEREAKARFPELSLK